jgi:hypothetical protein
MSEAKTADTPRTPRRPKSQPDDKMPPAGPHAKPELIDKDKTPGSGVLPDADPTQTDAPTG